MKLLFRGRERIAAAFIISPVSTASQPFVQQKNGAFSAFWDDFPVDRQKRPSVCRRPFPPSGRRFGVMGWKTRKHLILKSSSHLLPEGEGAKILFYSSIK
jgi:hypothetical protein